MMNEVEKMAAEMPKKKRSLRSVARSHDWLMPCCHFAEATFEEQMCKTQEEVAEVVKAHAEYTEYPDRQARMALLMECADIQMCIETLMYQIGASAQERTMARRQVWQKNNDRGYFKRKR